MEKPSDKLLVSRLEVNGMLHLPKNLSYELLPRTLFRGRVSMHEVREMMRRCARNGADWNGEELMDVNEITEVPSRTMFRVLKRAPHFRVSKKLALVSKTELLKAVLKRGK